MTKHNNSNTCPVEVAAGDLAQPIDVDKVREYRASILADAVYPVSETLVDIADQQEEIAE